MKKLTEEFAHKVYDILVQFGARKEDRDDFIYHHCDYEHGCIEWRFCGEFSYGGKYRSSWNGVTAYPESITTAMQKRLDECNDLLKDLKANFKTIKSIDELLEDLRIRMKVLEWLINGQGRLGIPISCCKNITPEWIVQHYNVEMDYFMSK